MTIHIPWNMHEAAICLHALIDVLGNKIARKDAVSDVSEKLRRMAVNYGYQIDDKFRNENGVNLQMLHLEYTLTKGESGLSPSEKWMENIVKLYRNAPLEYEKLLQEGNNILNNNNKRDDFIRWLHKNDSSNAGLIESSMGFSDLMLRNSGEIKSSVLDIDNEELLNRLLRRICTRRVFSNKTSRQRAEKYILACKKYNEFISSEWENKDVEEYVHSEAISSDNESVEKIEEKNFYRWMLDEESLSERTCGSYVSNIRSAEQYAKSNSYESWKLFGVNLDEAKFTASTLYKDPDFTKYDIAQHNRFHAAIGKLLEYLGGTTEEISHTIARVSQEKKFNNVSSSPAESPAIRSVLKHHFQNGFRVGSVIDAKRFKHFLETETGRATELDNDQLNRIIKSCGILYEGKVYLPDSMLSEELRERLFDYIEKCFSDGATTVFYEALFQHFGDEFLDYGIYNADMLKSYIAYYADERYLLGKSYLSKEYRGNTDPVDEIRALLKNHILPMRITDMAKALPHIPENKIRAILGAKHEFVRTSKGIYFHVDCFDISKEELEDIAAVMHREINNNGFLSGNELFNLIKQMFSEVYDRNDFLPIIGFRDALKYKLKDQFSFNGNIISEKKQSLSMSDVFSLYGKNRLEFTLQDLLKLVDEIGSGIIYFDSLYENSARVNEEQFVRKDCVSYKIEETDNILSRYCPGEFVPISEIENFGLFPDASHPWNEYLLENYLAFHSKRFSLMHTGYNRNCVTGAMVRRSSTISNYDELITKAIADSQVSLVKSEALSFLYDRGYIGRRTYQGVDSLLIKAREIRNRKEK